MQLPIRWVSFVLAVALFFSCLFVTTSVDAAAPVRPNLLAFKLPQSIVTLTLTSEIREHRTHVGVDQKEFAWYATALLPLHSDGVLNRPIQLRQHRATRSQALTAIYHTVQSGDTLWQIAEDDHTTVAALVVQNHLVSDLIIPGQRLLVFNGRSRIWNQWQEAKLRQAGLPLRLVPVYQAAGRLFHVPWTILAAIHRVETDFSTGAEVSSAGAQGPMQFMPATFSSYGVTAPGQNGPPQIDNVYDAIFSCAHLLHVDGYSDDPEEAIYLYNHSDTYVQTVEQFAESF
ncbi:MAG: lytic murein transglycosylase [Firmicutes bacterium]|nr:lytic murein transglycosylase [Bacillota bacterium]